MKEEQLKSLVEKLTSGKATSEEKLTILRELNVVVKEIRKTLSNANDTSMISKIKRFITSQ